MITESVLVIQLSSQVFKKENSFVKIRAMSLNKFIEEQISKGMSEGLFNNLKGAGKPLNLDDYFNTPEDLRIGYSILKSGNIIPPEVEMLREIKELKEQLKACDDETKKKQLRKALYEKELGFNLTMERYKRRK
jgi:hypothetical protein